MCVCVCVCVCVVKQVCVADVRSGVISRLCKLNEVVIGGEEASK